MQRSFFDVTPGELGQLGSELAVAVLREMVWAEVSNLGLLITDADIPFAITTPDGGVDAVVKGTPLGPGNGLIFAPITTYQVKAGAFPVSATNAARIEELLIAPTAIEARRKARLPVEGASHKPEDISPRVRDCLNADGTFVTVLFGDDNIDQNEDATENAIREFLRAVDAKYKNAKVKVWRQSKLCGLLRRYPAVSLQIKNLSGFPLLNHDQWSANPEMRRDFVAAPNQRQAIETLRTALRDDSRGTIHIRLIGEPGIGKTRLILETVNADDLRPLVLYADRGSKIDGSVLSALHAANDARIVLVVDECSPEIRLDLTRNFGSADALLKIVSIYQDAEEGDRSPEYRLFEVPLLPAEESEAIIKSYGVDPPVAKGWAELCEGSPRVAHVVGQNLRDHPDDPLRGDLSMVWDRYLAGDVDRNSEEHRRRHLVLSTFALFKRFGWSPRVREDAYEVLNLLIAPLDPGISKAQLGTIIDQMIGRKILQGDNFLYITPRALQLRLWIDWWNKHGAAIDMNDLVPKLSPLMRQWFGEMIEYSSAIPVTRELVANLLGPKGLYADAEWLKTKDGGRFFFSLSLADPEGALRLLQRTIGKMSRNELLKFEQGRRDVIWALEGIALHGELFRPAARLLLALAEAENETWSNNATGVFTGLFSLGYGEVAPTNLPPEHRLPVLLEALSQSEARADIALKAFDMAFNLNTISRFGGDQPFRLNERIQRWQPKTYQEWFEAYELYWKTLRKALAGLSPERRRHANAILLAHVREILRIGYLHNDILETVSEIANDPDFDNREIIKTIELVLNYDADGLPKDITNKLAGIRDELIGTSFSSRLRRYAGMDLIEDQIDREGNEIDKTASEVRQLADYALANLDDLRKELPWLITDEARNGYRFGYTLSQQDNGSAIWPDILAAWLNAGNNAHDYFIGGYLRAIFERDPTAWETIIRELSARPPVMKSLASVVWRSGMTEGVARLLLDMEKARKLRPQDLGIFSMGQAARPISDGLFEEWLSFLTGVGTFEAAATALHLASMSLLSKRQLKAELIRNVISRPELFERDNDRAEVMLAHYWLQLARTLIKLDPASELTVLTILLENIGKHGAITDSFGPEGDRYLDELVARHPAETWEVISRFITPPMDTRGFVISRWLRGDMGFGGRNPGPMQHIPRENIWKWIEADPERRAAQIANMAPKDFEPKTWPGSLVRELLCRFGDSDLVQSAVFSNFFTGGWAGPASSHYATEISALEEMLSAENDPNASRWLKDAIKSREDDLERAKIEEEARGY